MADKLKTLALRMGHGMSHAICATEVRETLATLDFALEKNYPARGEYIGAV